MREDLNHNDFADDVAGAKKGLDLHTEVKKKIHKIPVESIDSMGQRLLQRLPSLLISFDYFDPRDNLGLACLSITDLSSIFFIWCFNLQMVEMLIENTDRFLIFLIPCRLSSCESGNSYDSGYSGRDSTASNMTLNPDLQASIPSIMQLLDQIHSGQQQLLQLWQLKKNKLDQCLQLRMFEQDCEKVRTFSSLYPGLHN